MLRTGVRPDGRELAPMMPWRSYAALREDDMEALIAYLKSLEAVHHPVSPPVGAGEKPPGPYLTLIVPQ